MSEAKSYRVRDPQGNIYGPADLNTLRQWISEGRIVAGMTIAEEGSPDWADVSTYPGLSDLFGQTPAVPTSNLVANPYPGSTPSAYSTTPVTYAASTGPEMNVLALISMISGIVAIPMSCCCYGVISIPLAVAAIVMGFIALSQFRSATDRYTGRGMAIAGLICGFSAVVLTIAVVIAIFAFALASPGPRHF